MIYLFAIAASHKSQNLRMFEGQTIAQNNKGNEQKFLSSEFLLEQEIITSTQFS